MHAHCKVLHAAYMSSQLGGCSLAACLWYGVLQHRVICTETMQLHPPVAVRVPSLSRSAVCTETAMPVPWLGSRLRIDIKASVCSG